MTDHDRPLRARDAHPTGTPSMNTPRLRRLLYGFALLTFASAALAEPAALDEPGNPPAAFEASEFDLPPGDPWYPDAPQQRGPRPNPGDGLVFKMRIAPHWFDSNNRFWYRNDLPGGARSSSSSTPRHGTRSPAFDHARLAAALSKAAGQIYKADRLPFDEIAVRRRREDHPFRGGQDRLEMHARLLRMLQDQADGEDAKPARRRRASRTATTPPGSGARDRIGPGPSDGIRSPDGKWTAFVKDHNVFVRAEGKPEEIALSDDGKEGLAYGRLSWSPDSKTLVAFRIEPGERKEVYLIQSSPPGGGRAKLRVRALSAARRQVHRVRAQPLRRRGEEGDPSPRSTGSISSGPRLRWDKDGRHFTYEKIDRGHQRFRLIEVDSHTGEARNLIDEKSETFIWTAHRESVEPAARSTGSTSPTRSSTSRSATAGGTST